MSWGSSVHKTHPPPTSAFIKSLPLIVFLLVIAIATFVGYHLFISFQKISDAATHKLESKNVVFTKDGMRVGVKELRNENYVDNTQSLLVKAWNLSTWPAYKSRLWNKQQEQELKERKPSSKHGVSSHPPNDR